MRGTYRSRCGLLRIIIKYKKVLQLTALLAIGTAYFALLINYASTNIRDIAIAGHTTNYTIAKPSKVPQKDNQEKKFSSIYQISSVKELDNENNNADIHDVHEELEERRKTVWRVCVEKGLTEQGNINAWEFFIDSQHSLIWCNIFKAASSNWLYNFNLLAGYKENYLRRTKKSPLTLARSHYPRPSVDEVKAALPESLSFIIVREPFERLLSAYRNKIEGLKQRFYRKIGHEMAIKYRKSTTQSSNISPDKHQRFRGSSPTFPEFVDYVLDMGLGSESKFDEHWAPYYSFCTPCHVNFTVIAKVETLKRDQEYIIQKAGLENILSSTKALQRPKIIINKAHDGKDTADLIEKYYQQLTKDQIMKLYDIYSTDFEMFGYNATKYFEMGKDK